MYCKCRHSALPIVHTRLSLRHLISPKIPLPAFSDEKVTHVSKILPLLHLGRKTIFLDRLNETMTAVSSQKRGERKTNRKKAKGRGRMKGRGWRESVIVSLYIFSFSFHLHPILQHQTLTPLPRVGKSTDSIFSPPCCWDSETSLQLNADKRVVDSNIQNILLFLFFFLSPQQCAVFLISFTYKGLNIYKLALYMS